MITAQEALERLRAGNDRFAKATRQTCLDLDPQRRRDLVAWQEPFAVILGCSDSRVPAEIVFDQGLGDLFVIRVAGNVVASSQIGSVEFAVEKFGTPLVVVLGHTCCGAIQATVEDMLGGPANASSPNLRSIVDRIRPAVQGLLEVRPDQSREQLMRRAVRANVRASVNQLRYGSAILERHVQQSHLLIVGAEYDLASGVTDFFEMPSH